MVYNNRMDSNPRSRDQKSVPTIRLLSLKIRSTDPFIHSILSVLPFQGYVWSRVKVPVALTSSANQTATVPETTDCFKSTTSIGAVLPTFPEKTAMLPAIVSSMVSLTLH